MAHTCLEAESMIDYDNASSDIRQAVLREKKTISNAESVAFSAASTAIDTGAKVIIVLTETGFTARMVAKYKPAVPIIVITSSAHVATQTSGYMKNCRATCVDSMIDTQAIIKGALAEATSSGLLKVGDTTVAIYGDKDGESGSTNTMHIVSV